MPVTVKDLVITTNITGSSNEIKKNQQTPATAPMTKNDLELIIKEAVRRVMEELAYKNGR
jgi:hypothetical protein